MGSTGEGNGSGGGNDALWDLLGKVGLGLAGLGIGYFAGKKLLGAPPEPRGSLTEGRPPPREIEREAAPEPRRKPAPAPARARSPRRGPVFVPRIPEPEPVTEEPVTEEPVTEQWMDRWAEKIAAGIAERQAAKRG